MALWGYVHKWNGAIDVWAIEKAANNSLATLPKGRLWNPGVFSSNLRLVFLEPSARRSKDREIHANNEGRVSFYRRCIVLGSEDEATDTLCDTGGCARLVQRPLRPFGACLFVVGALRVIDRVVKPLATSLKLTALPLLA